MRISNILYKIDEIFVQNIFLMENKKNIIMDGKFTKIVYSDNLFTTNGIFISVPFTIDQMTKERIRRDVGGLCPDASVGMREEQSPGSISGIRCLQVSDLPTSSPLRTGQSFTHRILWDSSRTENRPTGTDGLVSDIFEDIVEVPDTSCIKCFLLFKTTYCHNEKIINDLIRIEYYILEFYKQIFNCKKKITTILKSQLNNACIKIYIDTSEYLIISKSKFPIKKNFVLKISGIWEDYTSIGLTYKFIAEDSTMTSS